MAPEYLCKLVSLRMSPQYYCKSLCLGLSHMVIVPLVLQPPLCGISCRQILEIRRLLKNLNPF